MSYYTRLYADEIAPTRFKEAGGLQTFYVSDTQVFPFILPIDVRIHGGMWVENAPSKNIGDAKVQKLSVLVSDRGRYLWFLPEEKLLDSSDS